jgi:hypothetical protein
MSSDVCSRLSFFLFYPRDLMTREWILRRSMLGAAILVSVSSCQGGDPSAPRTPLTSATPAVITAAPSHSNADRVAPGRKEDDDIPEGHVPRPIACRSDRVAVHSGRFGPAGGTLVFGESRLIIPGGALHDTVTITATPLNDGTSTVQFQPEGLLFHKPAGLVLNAENCSIPTDGTPSIVYLGEEGEVLETIPATYDPHWKAVAAPIVHFSGYAIAF